MKSHTSGSTLSLVTNFDAETEEPNTCGRTITMKTISPFELVCVCLRLLYALPFACRRGWQVGVWERGGKGRRGRGGGDTGKGKRKGRHKETEMSCCHHDLMDLGKGREGR